MTAKKREPEIDLALKLFGNWASKKLEGFVDEILDKVDDAHERQMPKEPRLTREQRVDSVLMAHVMAGKSLRSAQARDELRDRIINAIDADVSWSDVTDKP